jgi:FkbH-like protein
MIETSTVPNPITTNHGERSIRVFPTLGLALAGIYTLIICPLVASLLLGAIIQGLALDLLNCILLSPLLYFVWLLLMLSASAANARILRLLGYHKPRRTVSQPASKPSMTQLCLLSQYMQAYLVWSLPLVRALLVVPILRQLVLLAYSHCTDLGADSVIFGYVYDPDLTTIADGAVIGGESVLSCHSMATLADGSFVYTSAPIYIGARAVIGAQTRVSLGVHVGADAVVEAGSVIEPFTTIGSGEVWGGQPAAFRRHRVQVARNSASPTIMAEADALHNVVAEALDIPVSEVNDDLSSQTCAAWDSLGQMALAAGLHARFGLDLPAKEVFRLHSVADLRRAVAVQATPTSALASVLVKLPNIPELLPLFDADQVTRLLVAKADLPTTSALRVVIAATFTATPLATALRAWSRAFGVAIEVDFAGFNQVPQTLLADDSPFRRNPRGLNVVLARPEDLLPDDHNLLDAISAFAERPTGMLVVATLPPVVSATFPIDRPTVENLRANWAKRLREWGVEQFDFAAIIESIGSAAAAQRDMEVIACAPYSAQVYQQLGIALARLVRRHRLPPAKVLALDCDGLLWDGIVGEDGPNGVKVGGDGAGRAFQLLQKQIKTLQERGVLLVLVSRNEEADVWRVFDEHPGMVLRRSDIAAVRINWQPKSRSLQELAQELNLGLDSFVFLDDDAAMRLEVQANAPAVIVVPLSADPVTFAQTLAQLWAFDAGPLTAEDQARTTMVRQERQRDQLRQAFDLADYLRSLELKALLRPANAVDWPRVAQLTQKTNQFNLSLRRRTEAELRGLGAQYSVYVVEATDRIGDYGMIGAVIVAAPSNGSGVWQLDTLLLSCRALGRGIEDAIIREVLATVRRGGGRHLAAPSVAGPRNQPIKEFLARMGFISGADGTLMLEAAAERPLPAHLAWTCISADKDWTSISALFH